MDTLYLLNLRTEAGLRFREACMVSSKEQARKVFEDKGFKVTRIRESNPQPKTKEESIQLAGDWIFGF